jgi:hypothetical protein
MTINSTDTPPLTELGASVIFDADHLQDDRYLIHGFDRHSGCIDCRKRHRLCGRNQPDAPRRSQLMPQFWDVLSGPEAYESEIVDEVAVVLKPRRHEGGW